MPTTSRLSIAVIGTGISGLAAAWLLSPAHDVTVYEQAERAGGHANTRDVEIGGRRIAVDTGFIVFNRATYPNLSALLAHLGVSTVLSDMSFAASLGDGACEYSSDGLGGLFAQKRNLVRPRFWSMLCDLMRFYRNGERDAAAPGFDALTLGDYLDAQGYGAPFRDDHLLPMACAIWSATPGEMLRFPAGAFIRFHANHGLLKIAGRPLWETVEGGSIAYVRRLTDALDGRIRLDTAATRIMRRADGVHIFDSNGQREIFDHVIVATHANEALALLDDPSPQERALLGAFRYTRNLAVLHSDMGFMPARRAAWASWNYVEGRGSGTSRASFTYWMNRLQNIPDEMPLFVTLNPPRPPREESLHHSESYDHPLFDSGAIAAQGALWDLQGIRRTWFCGAYFGSGFHEDGLQAGLAVAEQLGKVRRPWNVPNESGRIALRALSAAQDREEHSA